MRLPRKHSIFLAGLTLVAGASLGAGIWPAPSPAGADPAACVQQLGTLPGGGAEASLGSEFEVLSWNLQKASRAEWRRDLENLGDGIELTFLQEATTEAAIADALPGRAGEAFAPGYQNEKLHSGVMTLSQVAPLVECDLQTIEPWLGTPKAVSVTQYSLAERPERLLAINIHAVNFALGLEDYRGQLAQLATLLDSHSGPAVVAGDFNTWREARQLALFEVMQRHGLHGLDFEPDHRSTFFGQAVDHIFIRGLEASAPRAIPVTSSDHNPLLVSLRLP